MTPSDAPVLELRDDPDGNTAPVYRRIAESIAEGIRTGHLSAGDRLPTHRALATQLGVAVPTVSRAYREAEQRGLISSTVGRGTFVSGIPTLRRVPSPEGGPPGHLDLSVNGPARGEHERLLRATLRDLASNPDLSALLTYEADIGGPADRQAAAEWLLRSGLDLDPAQIVICHGGQHAILVALGALLRPGDILLTEAMTYPGLKSAAQLLDIRVVGVEMDDHGIVPASLDAAFTDGQPSQPRPVAIYLMPIAHNPTAITLSTQRRQEIVQIAHNRDLQIIEDDVFGLLAPEHDRPTPLAALAPERTVYITSLSKTLTPGLRWGAVAGPPHLTNRFGALVRASIFNPAPMALDIARRWLTDGTADRLLAWQRTEMEARFDAARRLFGASSAVRSVRTGGLHAWIDFHDPWTPTEVIAMAGRMGIELGPTTYFHADTDSASSNHALGVRLCLGNAPSLKALTYGLTALVEALDRGPTFSIGTRV